ncbi:MAG: hypothetical protein AAFR04_05475 [Pseudomonadota bacterium]
MRKVLSVLFFSAIAVLVTYLIGTHTLGLYSAREGSAWASYLKPHEPRSALRVADRKLRAYLSEASNAKLKAFKAQQAAQARTAQSRTPQSQTPQSRTAQEPAARPDRRLDGTPLNAAPATTASPPPPPAPQAGIKTFKPPPLSPAARAKRDALFASLRQAIYRAQRADPHNARAFRMLGQMAAEEGDVAAATRFMRAAVKRSKLQSVAVYHLLLRDLEQRRYDDVLEHADVLMRSSPRYRKVIVPILASLLPLPAVRKGLAARLGLNPPWRWFVMLELSRNPRQPQALVSLLLEMKETPAPPTRRELAYTLNLLMGRKVYEPAYYAWLQFLPSTKLQTLGGMFNGGFEDEPDGGPFDWQLPRRPRGVTVDLATAPQRPGQALRLRFDNRRVTMTGVRQRTLLPPGRYMLSADYFGKVVGPRGLTWSMLCEGQHKPRATSRMVIGVTRTWSTLEFAFEVPEGTAQAPNPCRVQRFTLQHASRTRAERLVSGEIWFDNVKIERQPPARKAPAADPGR